MGGSPFQIELADALVARFRQGDLAAFEHIYRTFERPVYGLALRMTGSADRAHEVLQDAMLKAFERARQYRGEAPFWAWLRQLAVNEALMRLRRERRWHSESLVEDTLEGDEPAPWIGADAGVLEHGLAQLPAATRSVLWLYHVEGYTHAEIASLFGHSVSFSKSQLARGTRRLRELLTQEEATPCLIGTAPST